MRAQAESSNQRGSVWGTLFPEIWLVLIIADQVGGWLGHINGGTMLQCNSASSPEMRLSIQPEPSHPSYSIQPE